MKHSGFVFLITVFLNSFFVLKAQNTMRVHCKDNTILDISISRIDSITFVEDNQQEGNTGTGSLEGTWMWGTLESGYYELLTFNADRTYMGCDCYFEYGFESYSYGTYVNNGIMLNLWKSGYGYRQTYRWFISCLTENALEVVTQLGKYLYYRVRPEPIYIAQGHYWECPLGNSFVFADGVVVRIENGMLYGVSQGTTYIQMFETSSGLVFAYKVVVQ